MADTNQADNNSKNAGEIIAIYIAEESAAPAVNHQQAELRQDHGLVGDRHAGRNLDDQVTLVDADVIDQVNAATGWQLTPEQTRRNIVTRGIDLNQWETSEFRVGDALLKGVELCEPCATLGKILQTAERSPADVVKALVNKAGLRARVLSGAIINQGDQVHD